MEVATAARERDHIADILPARRDLIGYYGTREYVKQIRKDWRPKHNLQMSETPQGDINILLEKFMPKIDVKQVSQLAKINFSDFLLRFWRHFCVRSSVRFILSFENQKEISDIKGNISFKNVNFSIVTY